MNFLVVVVIGAVLGALDGVGIFFEPREPYKWQILFAATLKGVLVAVLTGFSLAATTRWWSAMLTGAFYGFAFSLVIYLAKGDPRVRRRAICHPKRDYHRRIDWPVHRHVGGQNNLTNRWSQRTKCLMFDVRCLI